MKKVRVRYVSSPTQKIGLSQVIHVTHMGNSSGMQEALIFQLKCIVGSSYPAPFQAVVEVREQS